MVTDKSVVGNLRACKFYPITGNDRSALPACLRVAEIDTFHEVFFPFSLSTRSSTSSDDRDVTAATGIVKNGYRGFGLFMELSIFGPRFAED